MSRYPTSPRGFEWTCPYCGASRLNTSVDEAGEENAVAALAAHVRASDGVEHGPVTEYPEGYDDLALADHVVRVDSRGDVAESDE